MDFINNPGLSLEQKEIIAGINKKMMLAMNPALYDHTISTLHFCEKLAGRYLPKIGARTKPGSFSSGSDIYFKLYAAALLHDYGKIFNPAKLMEIAKNNLQQINASESDLEIGSLLHGFAGAFLAGEEFNIKDGEILRSIMYHTVGYCEMTLQDKMIYIADKIEEKRNYDGLPYLRELSLKNIDLCLREVYKNNIIYIIKNNKYIYSETFKIWNNICRLYGGLLNGS